MGSLLRNKKQDMSNDLVSIIMLSHNKGRYVAESVRSVLAQTYQNWELIFMDDSSKDDTISQMMGLMEEGRWKREDGTVVNRVKVSKNVESRGSAASMNSALRDAQGRWIAFLNVGDLWEPTKLEKQIAFMEENDYAFTYTKYKYINRDSKDRGDMMGGLKVVTHKDLIKCCWMGYLTVMYDTKKLGSFRVRNIQKHNDYALWMDVSEKADCYLLEVCLASLRVNHRLLSPLPMFDKVKWRYEVFHTVEDLNPFISVWLTIRNMIGGFMKKVKYVEKLNRTK